MLGEKDFDKTCGIGGVVLRVQPSARGVEPRREDARVVEDEEVAGCEELRELGEEMVGECAGIAREREHAAGSACGRRMLRDELGRKIVVEVGDEHEMQG